MADTIEYIGQFQDFQEIYQGEYFEMTARLPWDATSCTYEGKIRNPDDDTLIEELHFSLNTATWSTDGYSELSYWLTDAETLAIPIGSYKFDVFETSATGKPKPLFGGTYNFYDAMTTDET